MPRTGDQSSIKLGEGFTLLPPNPNGALKAILDGTQKALAASQVSTTTSGSKYFTASAQGNFNELSFLLPQQPPGTGLWSEAMVFSGVPDWGVLKLDDAGLIARGLVTSPSSQFPNQDAQLYPYYWVAPEVADQDPFSPFGNDPASDPVFNVDPLLTPDPTYTGGGPGQAHIGGFTRALSVVETARILPTTNNVPFPVVVSGAVFPADRGVLALLHWPAAGTVVDFLAQTLDERCVAALLLGQGITGQSLNNCDGGSGVVFSEGPGFPGRETGQYDLDEIHAGVNTWTGDPIPPGPNPSAGQVRLGTDPNAGPVIPGGLPILGGTTLATGGGNDNNFFRYRLPYLSSYASLPLVPTVERPRYFTKPPVSLDNATDLTSAGNYSGFSTSFASFQIARFRHRFDLPNFAPGTAIVEQGSYLLLHFKREADFESFVRDGIMPDDLTNGYELWSASLIDYVNPEDVDNLTEGGLPAATDIDAAVSYHVLRGSIVNDQNTLDPTTVTAKFDYTTTLNEVMFVSGIQYFVPNGPLGTGDAWSVSQTDLQVSGLFDNTYLLGYSNSVSEITPGLRHRNPLFLYVPFTTGINISTPAISTFTGTVKSQRVEFNYAELGAFDLVTGPTTVDVAVVTHSPLDPPLSVSGDNTSCFFWTDARLRAFSRRPPGHETVADSAIEHLFDRPGLNRILFHTTKHSPSFNAPNAIYGNFTVPPLNTPRLQLETFGKDVKEVFLDEVYRIALSQVQALDPTWDGANGNLVGPGLPFVSGSIELPVRFASSPVGDFGFASFLQNQYHLASLVNPPVDSELQVAGLPDRNPPLSDGVVSPAPQTGVLQYPKTDYSIGYRPSLVDGDTTTSQPDYTGLSGTRGYLRVFDAAYSNWLISEPGVVGQPFLKFRIDGLTLSDFAYSPPGPGSTDISLQVKIPGLTTWMDIGRRDGDGPSKQDPFQDGAGCQVLGPDTFDSVDPRTGIVFCQVLVHVGPVANVFGTTGAVPGVPAGIAPVMILVGMSETSSLDFQQGGPNGTSSNVRGLISITVLRN